MEKQIVIAGLSLLLISGCVTGKRDLSEMSQTVEATQDIHTAPELGTAVSGDYIIAGDNDDAAGSRLSRIVLDGVASNCLSGAGTLVPCGGDLVNDTTPQLGGDLDVQTHSIEGVDATEFGYLDGTTSDIQTQFGLKADIANETHTGTTTITNLIVTTSLDIPGTIDFGSATSLEIPNVANPTVNVAGEIALDTTDDQLTYYGSAQRTIRYEEEICVTLEDLAAADDDYAFMSFRDAVTITGVWCHYRGTGTTAATIDLEDGAGNAMTHTDATCSASTGVATPQSVTAANTLTAYEMLAFNVTNAVSPETDAYTICVSYTVTEQ